MDRIEKNLKNNPKYLQKWFSGAQKIGLRFENEFFGICAARTPEEKKNDVPDWQGFAD
ncbi:MAG: hypothetical protein LBC99_00520 [Spirochaetota bacterium]|jgi:hypothetical protein|nr:hypothetical protein [Spirochaetota bacterium]